MDDVFEGSIIENMDRFKELLRKYNERIIEIKKRVAGKLDKILEIKKVEMCEKWHLKVLKGKRVVGVDGSQISPFKELGIPIGLVQSALIWIKHGEGLFGKRYRTKIVEIDENIDFKRFQLETEMLLEEMNGESWLFFDGALIPYFEGLRNDVARIVERIVKESERTGTPVIGYIDKSFSRDIAKRMGIDLYDIYILDMDDLSYTQPIDYRLNICFSYIKIAGTPVRIEFPCWMREIHDDVIRVVMAECMLGKTRAYPYILERAHSYSLIDSKTRENLMKAIKSSSISFKWISKMM